MTGREKLDKYITETYGVIVEFPWIKYSDYGVYRHSDNSKWFAVIMDIPKSKIGFPSEEIIEVVNLKCDPILIGSLLKDDGIYPGYHMNKAHWITVVLDGAVDDEKLKWLLNISFCLTGKPKKKR